MGPSWFGVEVQAQASLLYGGWPLAVRQEAGICYLLHRLASMFLQELPGQLRQWDLPPSLPHSAQLTRSVVSPPNCPSTQPPNRSCWASCASATWHLLCFTRSVVCPPNLKQELLDQLRQWKLMERRISATPEPLAETFRLTKDETPALTQASRVAHMCMCVMCSSLLRTWLAIVQPAGPGQLFDGTT